MGKTTLLFHLLAKFDRTARTAFLFQTQCSSREFMRFLLAEIGIETDSQDFVRCTSSSTVAWYRKRGRVSALSLSSTKHRTWIRRFSRPFACSRTSKLRKRSCCRSSWWDSRAGRQAGQPVAGAVAATYHFRQRVEPAQPRKKPDTSSTTA